jgi:hypothetical protein
MDADKKPPPKASTSIINRKSSIINRDAYHFPPSPPSGRASGLSLVTYHLSLFSLAAAPPLFYNPYRISRPHHRPARNERQPVRPVGDFE